MELVCLILITLIILILLYKLAERYDKYRIIISIVFGGICVVSMITIYYLHDVNNRPADIEYMLNVANTVNDEVDEIDVESMEEMTMDQIVRYLSSAVLNNAELTPANKIETVQEMFEFTDKFRNTGYVTDWVRCYGKYIGWCLAEYSLDEESDDFWEMKYKSSDKVASYNYGLIVSYKKEGFFIQYAPAIGAYLIMVQVFVWVLWSMLFVRNLYNKWRNKNDLQE